LITDTELLVDTADLLDTARVGIAGLDVSPTVQDQATEAVRLWLEDGRFRTYRGQITALIEQARWTTLLDSFYRTLPFGTGGRRGTVGVGPNRFNPWTLGASVEGHARWLRAKRGDGPLSVVIGYDVRVFQDLGQQLISDVSTTVLGMSSRDFAEIAAEVYAAAEIAVFLPPKDQFLSTPELSHAVRFLAADGGLVISASHNPPDDNGSKFYHAHGGQMVPPFDAQLGDMTREITAIDRMPLDRARATGLVREIEPRVGAAYVQANLNCARHPEARSAHIVFTSLHGTGRATVVPVLAAAGFRVDLEPTQSEYDGAFPNVPFQAPNPERPATLAAAKHTANRLGADLVMACDPDADRLGVSVRHPRPAQGVVDGWRDLNGNEIATLVCHQALANHPQASPVVFKTAVSSTLVERVAHGAGARVVGDLLVGFKYIGAAMDDLETTGQTHGLEATIQDFAAGLEESHGVLLTTDIRDKDAAGGALVLAELASREAIEGRTLVDTLMGLWERFGYVHNQLFSLVMRGASGKALIDGMLDSVRQVPLTRVGGLAVTAFNDRRDTARFGPILSETDAASRNMLVWQLGAEARLILRPSGTEPKCKIYIEIASEPGCPLGEEMKRAKERCQALCDDFILEVLGRVDISLPRWALRMDDLVSIDERCHFVDTVFPGLLSQIDRAQDDAGSWLAGHLDRRVWPLYSRAVQAYVHQNRPGQGAVLTALFGG
jgi:phosphoglucomutase